MRVTAKTAGKEPVEQANGANVVCENNADATRAQPTHTPSKSVRGYDYVRRAACHLSPLGEKVTCNGHGFTTLGSKLGGLRVRHTVQDQVPPIEANYLD